MSDRKYRQRGYQDDDAPRDRRGQPSREREPEVPGHLEGAPRGRGVGLPGEVAVKCARCGTAIHDAVIAPGALCRTCGSALHSCTNCAFFDTGSRFECRKPIQARIESKLKANACPHFEPKTVRDLRSKTAGAPSDPRAAFDALFKK